MFHVYITFGTSTCRFVNLKIYMIVRRIDVRVEKNVKFTSTGCDDVIGQTRECVLMVLYREHGSRAVGEESFAKGQGNVASL